MWSKAIRFFFGKTISQALGAGIFFLVLMLFFGASDRDDHQGEGEDTTAGAE